KYKSSEAIYWLADEKNAIETTGSLTSFNQTLFDNGGDVENIVGRPPKLITNRASAYGFSWFYPRARSNWMFRHPSGRIYVIWADIDRQLNLWYSDDDGDTWIKKSVGVDAYYAYDSTLLNNKNIVVSSRKIYEYNSAAESWREPWALDIPGVLTSYIDKVYIFDESGKRLYWGYFDSGDTSLDYYETVDVLGYYTGDLKLLKCGNTFYMFIRNSSYYYGTQGNWSSKLDTGWSEGYDGNYDVFCNDNKLYNVVSYWDSDSNTSTIYFYKGLNGTEEIVATSTTNKFSHPQIVVSDFGDAYVFYVDSNAHKLYMRKRNSNGVWENPILLERDVNSVYISHAIHNNKIDYFFSN
ncbi:MAG: hypothetical protein ACE5KE_13105, partial [Methanosarcinales archaeon]